MTNSGFKLLLYPTKTHLTRHFLPKKFMKLDSELSVWEHTKNNNKNCTRRVQNLSKETYDKLLITSTHFYISVSFKNFTLKMYKLHFQSFVFWSFFIFFFSFMYSRILLITAGMIVQDNIMVSEPQLRIECPLGRSSLNFLRKLRCSLITDKNRVHHTPNTLLSSTAVMFAC